MIEDQAMPSLQLTNEIERVLQMVSERLGAPVHRQATVKEDGTPDWYLEVVVSADGAHWRDVLAAIRETERSLEYSTLLDKRFLMMVEPGGKGVTQGYVVYRDDGFLFHDELWSPVYLNRQDAIEEAWDLMAESWGLAGAEETVNPDCACVQWWVQETTEKDGTLTLTVGQSLADGSVVFCERVSVEAIDIVAERKADGRA